MPFGAGGGGGGPSSFLTYTGTAAVVTSQASTSLVANAPAGVQANTLVLMPVMWSGAGNNITLPDGTWHAASALSTSAGGTVINFQVFYRIATGVDTTYTFTFSASSSKIAKPLGYNGANLTTPVDANNGTFTATATATTFMTIQSAAASVICYPLYFFASQSAIANAMTLPGARFNDNSSATTFCMAVAEGFPLAANQMAPQIGAQTTEGTGGSYNSIVVLVAHP
jgi:hypothetical protein